MNQRSLFLIGLIATLASADALTFRDVGRFLASTPTQPEGPSGMAARHGVSVAERHMISSANLHASAAGLEMLRAGGGAADAAIAAVLVLNLVEPQSSGIGGGGYLLFYDAAKKKIEGLDGRETAPASARPDMFLDAAAEPMPFEEAVESGSSVGVPGLVRLLEEVHRRHGRLPWARLFEPAIALAENGFLVSPRLHTLLARQSFFGAAFSTASAYFFNSDGTPKPVGARIVNHDFAETLRRIAREGADAFYKGQIAEAISAAVAQEPRPARLTAADLAGYAVKERQPLCGPFRNWLVCGAGPSSSGGVAVNHVLGILGRLPVQKGETTTWARVFAEANRRAFIERDRYVADPDFEPVPLALLTDATKFDKEARAIMAEDPPPPGHPQNEPPSTTHLSVVDDEGNAVALTASIETAFGSRRMVAGFLLNSELTDFSMRPAGVNQALPGKRPRSSMAPTMAFTPDGRLGLVVGSPGGPYIIAYVAKTLVGVIEWGLSIQQAIDLPNLANRNGETELEVDTALAAAQAAFGSPGGVLVTPLTSGLQGVAVRGGHLEGGSDLRREGVAIGD